MILASGFEYLPQQMVLPPSDLSTNVQMLLRWIHFLAGITWLGLLYFFNLVNVEFMKKLDAPTRSKVVPALMPSALWWFRWAGLVTVLAGLAYFIFYILLTEPPENPGQFFWKTFIVWLVLVVITFKVQFLLLRVSALLKNGWLFGALFAVLILIMIHMVVRFNTYEGASNRALSIGVGGGMGMIMLFNVWGIIWPAQKRIIAWTQENAEKGTAVPPESATLARRVFLVSRANAWLSIPMLFFMAAASHYPVFVGG
jgi:uncharacterized membrane protein